MLEWLYHAGFEGDWEHQKTKEQPSLSNINIQSDWSGQKRTWNFSECFLWVSRLATTSIRFKRQQGGGGILFWAAIYKKHLIGPFRVDDGVELDLKSYCGAFNEEVLSFHSKPLKERKKLAFMHDNARSHTSHFKQTF